MQPTAEQLASAPEPPASIRRDFTKLPDSLPSVVASTARKVTEGAADPYDQAVKLQDWFAVTGGFEYDTQVQVGSGSQAIARFLKDKQGFCVHFSFAMAAMAGSLGIPARVAVGFAPGSPQADGSVSVGLRDAHAWPELYFEGVGWTRFEPTPNRGSMPSYTLPDDPGSSVPDAARPSETSSAAPSATPSARESCTPEQKKLDGGCASESRRRRCPRTTTARSGTRSWPGPWRASPPWRSPWPRCCGACGRARSGLGRMAAARRTLRCTRWPSGRS
ncbi:transglutaminase-like domain-containing protein [Streptomyces purpurascens]